MNDRQLSDRIGNIDDRLIEQAQELPQRVKARLSDRARRWAAAAAVVALMSASFGAGALAFGKETIVEVEVPVEVKVPQEQATVELTDIGITLILPDDWKGRYGVEQIGLHDHYSVYSTEVREAFSRWSGSEDEGGMLFYILKWDQQLTEEEWHNPYGAWNYSHNRYIMATKDGTYLLYYASDVQYPPDMEDEYWQMRNEIDQIRFVADGALWDPSISYHGENHELLAVDIKLAEDDLSLIREAEAAHFQGDGQPAPAPESNYFLIPEAKSVWLLYQMDGKSYLWREGRAVPLTQPLFGELYQGITEQEYAQSDSLKWLLREDNGKLMLIYRSLADDTQEPRQWYEENFFINEREQKRYIYMGDSALVSLVDKGDQEKQGLAILLPETMPGKENRLYACCLLAYFSIAQEELSVSSIKAQLVTCDVRGTDAITDMISNQLEFDMAVGKQELLSERAPEIEDYRFSETEACRLVEELLSQVFPLAVD